ncbi:MAG: aromatic ring-hydroxylating dioxygenase subunit alpha [Gaiellaceae bacterium MAG52_C11]|nr:aromatic ring-hydroxylating dioxygenase subunit alpha [Candidatus Gaiellasilicea maunaloa]
MATVANVRTIPFDWYADPAVLRQERDRIFRRTWQYAGRADQVAAPGSFFACEAGGIPIVVVRGRDEELRAFLNVCRHRGSLVCEGEGRRETLQCPYHAWTYELDGSLRAAPRADREAAFDRSELGLRPVQVDAWGPFVFVNPDPAAAPLAATLGELPRLVAAAGLDLGALRFLKRVHSTYEANWKVCCENFLECYHCQVAHPGFSKVVDVSADAYVLEPSRWFSTQLGPVRERWSGDFDPRGPVARGQFHFFWPNATINVMPGHPNLSIGPVVPTGVETTARFLDYYVGPDVDAAWLEEMLAFDDQVGAEDVVLIERAQKGLRSGGLEHGHLLPESERLIAHFQGLLVEALAD